MHEQHAGHQQSGFMPPGAAAAAQDGAGGDGAAELTPNDEAWEPAFIKLIKREGFVGKEADVKWRVILQSGKAARHQQQGCGNAFGVCAAVHGHDGT
jgi:hypothetical protein